MSIRFIVSDIDATILPNGGQFSQITKDAVRACGEAGILFVLCSGRWYVSARRFAEELGIREGYMIVSNGGAIVDICGHIIHSWPIPEEKALLAWDIMKEFDTDIITYTRNAIYSANPFRGKTEPERESFLGGAYCTVYGDPEEMRACGLQGAFKLAADTENYEIFPILAARLREAGFTVSSSHKSNLEIMLPGTGKGAATEWLAARLNIPREERMAFGDNTNDLDMFKAVKWSVAVDNAVKSVKEAASLVTARCEENGVARIIRQVLAGEIG